ncbi:MAG: chromate efflux transporter [Pseudopelagicola sp.]|nr:chromate efflux transporter [Pseudopelagicola sp.]
MPAPIPFAELLRVFGRIGLLSFGGPAAQISLMHRELVASRRWLSETQFMGALSFCMLLPGPEAMQLATYSGWRLRGVMGGLIGGGLFVLPGAVTIALLGALYINYGTQPLVAAAFLGVQATVVAIVLQALARLGPKVLTSRLNITISVGAFLALYTGLLPFPAVIILAAVLGALTRSASTENAAPPPPTSWRKLLRTVLIWTSLWAAPILLTYALGFTFLTDIALFFSKLAIVTFGGAYAVLAYMVQAVSQDHGWLTTGQMMDALGLAETTPGPLILVTQFTGQLAGYYAGGWPMALAASLLTLWVTFIPCFLWIFAAAPYIETLLAQPRLTAALQGISAAVLGVIANLSLWFALHLLFNTLHETPAGLLPDLTSLRLSPLALIGLAALLLLKFRLPLLATLFTLASVATGLALAASLVF